MYLFSLRYLILFIYFIICHLSIVSHNIKNNDQFISVGQNVISFWIKHLLIPNKVERKDKY